MNDFSLTPTEKLVIKQLCISGTNKAIAYAMKIEESTIKVHFRNIVNKTRMCRVLLAVWAVRNGFDK